MGNVLLKDVPRFSGFSNLCAGPMVRLAAKVVSLALALTLLVFPCDAAQTQPRSAQHARVLAQGSEQFPQRSLRVIVQFPPGGSSDVVARIMAVALGESLGQHVVVDNRGGAAGNIGAETAARASPDGYTLFTCNIATFAISPALYRKLAYNPETDFAPLGGIGSTPSVLVVYAPLPPTTIAEFVAHVQAMFSTVPTVITAIRAGRIRALGVTSAQRSPDLPEVPTIAEFGMPDFEATSWQAMCTPSGVQQAVLARLRMEFSKAIVLPETVKRLADQGMQPFTMTLAEFDAFIRAERAKWAKVVKDAGIQPL